MLPLNICKGKSSRWLRESPEQVACRLKKYSRQAGKLDLYALTYKCSDKWTAHSAYAHALTGKYLHRGMHVYTRTLCIRLLKGLPEFYAGRNNACAFLVFYMKKMNHSSLFAFTLMASTFHSVVYFI